MCVCFCVNDGHCAFAIILEALVVHFPNRLNRRLRAPECFVGPDFQLPSHNFR